MKHLKNSCLASAAFFVFVGMSAPASAVVMQATYTGFLYSTSDTGLFGLGPGVGVLDGREFSMTYIYDSTGFGSGSYAPHYSSFNQVYGGTIYNASEDPDKPNPVLSGTLTINGHSESILGDDYGNAIHRVIDPPDPTSDFSSAYHLIDTVRDDGVTRIDSGAYTFGSIYSLAIPLSLEIAFSTDVGNTGHPNSPHPISYFSIDARHYENNILVTDYFAAGYFDVRHLTVSLATSIPPPEVPLPAALPLFAAGLSAIGFTGWRKKRRAA